MVTRVRELKSACQEFFQLSIDRDFVKSYVVGERGERAGVLPSLKWFLAGRLSNVEPEARANTQDRQRIDFIVDGIAVEVAVRSKGKSKSSLKKNVNASEVKKLMRWGGSSALVLFDYSRFPLSDEELSEFRDYPSLGKGNFRRNPFNILYYWLEGHEVCSVRKVVRIKKSRT